MENGLCIAMKRSSRSPPDTYRSRVLSCLVPMMETQESAEGCVCASILVMGTGELELDVTSPSCIAYKVLSELT